MKYWTATRHRLPGSGLVKLGLTFQGKYVGTDRAVIAREGI